MSTTKKKSKLRRYNVVHSKTNRYMTAHGELTKACYKLNEKFVEAMHAVVPKRLSLLEVRTLQNAWNVEMNFQFTLMRLTHKAKVMKHDEKKNRSKSR